VDYFFKNDSVKNKGFYWYLWFHEEPLTFMEPFYRTKVSL